MCNRKNRYTQLSYLLCERRRWLKKEVFGISILCLNVNGVQLTVYSPAKRILCAIKICKRMLVSCLIWGIISRINYGNITILCLHRRIISMFLKILYQGIFV